MDVQTAIQRAKAYVTDIFGPEGAFNIGLEEVQFAGGSWAVTIGFSRPWDRGTPNALLPRPDKRTYKVVQIDDADGTVKAVINRDTSGEG